MGILSFIGNTVIDYSASQGDTRAIELVKRREEMKNLKKQKKSKKKRTSYGYEYHSSRTAVLDDPIE